MNPKLEANKPDTPDLLLPSSFRDPSGFVFQHNGHIYRQVNYVYRENYQMLMDSGLYERLVRQKRLIPHEEVDGPVLDKECAWKIIKPEQLEFISYPFEWCFSQLKDAALLTLDIQLTALEYGMTLKDASAYNIQFHKGHPMLIDTLSFEKYVEGKPWAAYRQFCQHFLAPLALMAKKDIELNRLLLAYIDGIPLELTSKLLPRSTWFNPGLLAHVHLHAVSQKKYSEPVPDKKEKGKREPYVSKAGLIGIIQSLRGAVEGLKWNPGGTEWADYYNITNYSNEAFDEKRRLVREFLQEIKPEIVWDLGANTGVFSRIAAELNAQVISFDVDPSAVEQNYRTVKEKKEKNILPLIQDLTNPSPGLGWNGSERDSLFKRGPADCIMALALIHHLAISNNVPFEKIAQFFYGLCEYLIIEFVPKEDSRVQKLLSSRVDIFDNYYQTNFEEVFSRYFKIMRSKPIPGSKRTLYLMKQEY